MTSLLEIHGVIAQYAAAGAPVRAVDGVSLELREGEVLGVAGESGCGKSTLAAVLALAARPPLRVLAGEMAIEGARVSLVRPDLVPRRWRGGLVALLPQGAMNALNPTRRVRDLAHDVIRAHEPGVRRAEALDLTRERLERLSLPVRVLDSYPHQLSGGMRQRVVAVVSTLLNPSILIADEPTSALDVSAQRALVRLLRRLLDERLVRAIMLITHDLPLLATAADRVAIMYAGRLCEVGPARPVLDRPGHPYTRALLATVLAPEPSAAGRRVEGIPGAPPDLRRPPPGCRFAPRCEHAMDVCGRLEPPVVGDAERHATCWWLQGPGVELVPA
jgi:peptide/nickel transport system ATP-binding protein